ncbi:unnamed protein product [Ilex paraguariensis]|uniref:Uncharacterized protein n=1 Tax=Ilex paraguariensis TaxID=185542 RepID=A0ABC8U748_9AQUA
MLKLKLERVDCNMTQTWRGIFVINPNINVSELYYAPLLFELRLAHRGTESINLDSLIYYGPPLNCTHAQWLITQMGELHPSPSCLLYPERAYNFKSIIHYLLLVISHVHLPPAC